MTSEPDSKPGRRPPTIELKATEVEQPEATASSGETAAADTPPPESASPASPSPPSNAGRRPRPENLCLRRDSRRRGGGWSIVAALWFTGVIPSARGRGASPSYSAGNIGGNARRAKCRAK